MMKDDSKTNLAIPVEVTLDRPREHLRLRAVAARVERVRPAQNDVQAAAEGPAVRRGAHWVVEDDFRSPVRRGARRERNVTVGARAHSL